jgi:hypothetical protein
MAKFENIVRSPIDFLPGDTVGHEGMLMRVDKVHALTANLVRVEGNVMSFPVSTVMRIGHMTMVTRTKGE